MRNGFKFLKQVESKTSQFEINQFKVKESFKPLLAKYVIKTFGLKITQQFGNTNNFKFSAQCGRVRPAKLANHSALTNLEI